ncbi:MAG: class I SAM-dependent methyltransferase [bacterium]|nr:class I SAM-dependent methyltransferase [bacterium]
MSLNSDWPDIRPDDRVLLTSIPDHAAVRLLAARLETGILVGLGTIEEVVEARRSARDHTNAMFQPGSAEEIPWQNEFFSVVVDARSEWNRPQVAVREIFRVLAPGGVAHLKLADPRLGVDIGFEESPADGAFQAFRKPESSAGP